MTDPNLVVYIGRDLHHVADHIFQGVPKAAVDLFGRGIDRAADRIFGRTLDKKVENVEQVAARLEATLQVAAEDIRRLERRVETHETILREAGEPATLLFVTEGIEAAMQSPDTAKQCVLGDLIAARLTKDTESLEELQLRGALRIVRDCSSRHILALARVQLVTAPPFAFENRVPFDAVRRFFIAVDEATASSGAAYLDMKYLVSLGALTEDSRSRDDVNGSSSPWMNLFLTWGRGVYDDDVMAFENRVQMIAENRTPQGIEYGQGVAYGNYELTPPGYEIASRVASRLSGLPMGDGAPAA
jgi:hypothetical protein